MGYPMTTFDLYTDGEFKAAINIVGDATAQWPKIVDIIASRFDMDEIRVYNMKNEQVALVTL